MGSVFGLGCALTWSVAIVMFKHLEDDIHPIVVNLFKNILGLLLIAITLYATESSIMIDTKMDHYALIMISGFMGIGIADALVLRALKVIGASRLAILECAYSPSVIVLSVLFLGESLNYIQALGTFLILGAIVLVSYKKPTQNLASRELIGGSLLALFGVVMMAAGILIIKPLFAFYPLIWIIELRLLAGVLGSALMASFLSEKQKEWDKLTSNLHRPLLWVSSIMAAYISMILWVGGYKFQDASTTAILNQTATIFTVLLAAYFLKERLDTRKILGAILAFSGVILITTH